MRFLILHVNSFCCTITTKGRSKVYEDYDDPVTRVDEALIVLASVERGDERAADLVAKRAGAEIVKLATQLKVTTVVLHPFAHLFGELSTPEVAIEVLSRTQQELVNAGLRSYRTPFGWFNTLQIDAKGHPLSRVARIVTADSYTKTATATTNCTAGSPPKTRTRTDTFTYTYVVTPSFDVAAFTAWDLVSTTGPSTASLNITAKIAGESVVKSNKFLSPGKFSFSLRDSLGNSRVTGLDLLVNGVSTATPGSTLEENCPDCLAGELGAVDFDYVTNAGSNGTTTLLMNGDARTILNSDITAANDNGGADGRALARAVMDPVQLDLAPGIYTVTLTGTVKGNAASNDLGFSVTQTINIITPGCGS